jgi:mRNA interferase MazF
MRASRGTVGHEQKGTRPAVILQSDRAWWLATVIIAPTSSSASAAEYRPEITLSGRSTRVLLDQLKSVDRTRLGRTRGHIAAADLREVDEALSLILGLF